MERFGADAHAFGAVREDRPGWIAADATTSGPASFSVTRLRAAGHEVTASLLLPDPRVAALQALLPLLRPQLADPAARDGILMGLRAGTLTINDAPWDRFAPLPPEAAVSAATFVRLADRLAVRSEAEAQRIAAYINYRHPRTFLDRSLDPTVPAVAARGRSVVVWARTLDESAVELIRAAIARLGIDATFVLPHTPDPAGILASAGTIIEAGASDPATARALLRCGAPIVVGTEIAGALEADGLSAFTPWDYRSISDAIAAGLSGPIVSIAASEPSPVIPLTVREVAPRVSVVVPTLDRFDGLRRALRSIERQRYPNIETIVVNDGGQSPAAALASFDRVTLVERERSGGPSAARNAGIARASGTYVAFVDDDDAMLPAHIERLVNALERSHLAFAYADFALCFVESAANGELAAHGLHVQPANGDREDQLVQNGLGILTTLVRRDVLRPQPFDEELLVCEDYELWLDLATRTPFTRVDAVTALYTVRTDVPSASSYRAELFVRAYERIYERYPVTAPALLARRATVLQQMAAGAATTVPRAPWRVTPSIRLADIDGLDPIIANARKTVAP